MIVNTAEEIIESDSPSTLSATSASGIISEVFEIIVNQSSFYKAKFGTGLRDVAVHNQL